MEGRRVMCMWQGVWLDGQIAGGREMKREGTERMRICLDSCRRSS